MKRRVLLVAALGVLVFCAYQGLLYYDNNFRFGRMWETPAVRPLEEPALFIAQGIVPPGGGEALLRATPPELLHFPEELPSDATVRGRILYFTFCAQCHGKHLDGNGTVGQSFQPLPGDLRSKRIQSLADGIIFKEISYGIPGGRQPPLATTISIADRWRIIAYLKSLGPRP